jgi:hypothetical protein
MSALKACRGMEVWLHKILILALLGSKYSALLYGCLSTRDSVVSIGYESGWGWIELVCM